MTSPRIDLHTHSTASDGLLSPTELVTQARQVGLSLIALTDHDDVDGIAEARQAGQQLGVEVIAGIEVNTNLPEQQRGEVHILGYFIQPLQPALNTTLAELRDLRVRRGQKMVAQLQTAGCEITWDEVRALARGAVGRPHLARALIMHGYATSVPDAFDRWLSPGMPGYAPRVGLTHVEAVRLIQSGGGIAAVAHPAGIPGLEDAVLPELLAAGLVGLECFYGQYDDATVSRLVALARAHRLVPTGGSDYHGPGIHPTPLGRRYVPPQTIDLLRERAAQAAGMPVAMFTLPARLTQAL